MDQRLSLFLHSLIWSLSFPQLSDLICVVCLLGVNQTPSGNPKAHFLSLYHFSLWSKLCIMPSWSRSSTTNPLQPPSTPNLLLSPSVISLYTDFGFSVFWSFRSLSLFFFFFLIWLIYLFGFIFLMGFSNLVMEQKLYFRQHFSSVIVLICYYYLI